MSVSKHGIWGLTKSLAKEFGPAGVTTNTISPGPIDTRHADEEMNHHIQSMVGRVPVGRLGLPEEIAGLCGYLCGAKGGLPMASYSPSTAVPRPIRRRRAPATTPRRPRPGRRPSP